MVRFIPTSLYNGHDRSTVIGKANQKWAMQISMPLKQLWMPHIGIKRYSMTAMTEIVYVGKGFGRVYRHAGMQQWKSSQKRAL